MKCANLPKDAISPASCIGEGYCSTVAHKGIPHRFPYWLLFINAPYLLNHQRGATVTNTFTLLLTNDSPPKYGYK